MEIRDPIHQFISVSELERRVIDTAPVQRLRRIHQLSTGWLVWPGAQHTRFEHALGTMELAGRALEAAFKNSDQGLLERLDMGSANQAQMKAIVRLGGLLHDVGHPPFSHGPESLLPLREGKPTDHEVLTGEIIASETIASAIRKNPIASADIDAVIDVALGSKHRNISNQTIRLLSDLVTGTVGVDRMDYLLRDSQSCGVGYGRFDIARLVGSLKIVEDNAPDGHGGPMWAVAAGGQYDAEHMLLARWFMFLQVYTHKTRRVLDEHLKRFLGSYLPKGRFPANLDEYLLLTDYEILSAAYISDHPDARALVGREHLRLVSEFGADQFRAPEEFETLANEVRKESGNVWADSMQVTLTKPGDGELWVEDSAGVRPLSEHSELIRKLTPRWIGRIYAPLEDRKRVEGLIKKHQEGLSDRT